MKTITILILGFLLSSCAARMGFNEHIQVYKTEGIMLSYLILRPDDKTYDEYSDIIGCGALGSFEIKGDTLCLVPKFNYGHSSWIGEDGSQISYMTTFPSFLRIKKDRLINITDYTKHLDMNPFVNNIEMADYVILKTREKN